MCVSLITMQSYTSLLSLSAPNDGTCHSIVVTSLVENKPLAWKKIYAFAWLVIPAVCYPMNQRSSESFTLRSRKQLKQKRTSFTRAPLSSYLNIGLRKHMVRLWTLTVTWRRVSEPLTIDSGAGCFFGVRGCRVHCRMCGSIPALYCLDAGGTVLLGQWKVSPDITKCPLAVQIAPLRLTASVFHSCFHTTPER